MSTPLSIRVCKPSEMDWSEAWHGPDETEAPGTDATAFEVGPFSVGLWQRDAQCRDFERPYHEIAYIIEGEVEVTTTCGEVLRAGPGDILVTPKGSKGTWRSLSPVRKFWAVFEE